MWALLPLTLTLLLPLVGSVLPSRGTHDDRGNDSGNYCLLYLMCVLCRVPFIRLLDLDNSVPTTLSMLYSRVRNDDRGDDHNYHY